MLRVTSYYLDTNSNRFLNYSFDNNNNNNNNANMQVHIFNLTNFSNAQRICAFGATSLLCVAVAMMLPSL